MDKRDIVVFVLKVNILWELKYLLKFGLEFISEVKVLCRPVPERDGVFTVSNADDAATDFVCEIPAKLTTDNSKNESFPQPVGQVLANAKDELSTETVVVVLPHRLDTLLENVVVNADGEFRRRL